MVAGFGYTASAEALTRHSKDPCPRTDGLWLMDVESGETRAQGNPRLALHPHNHASHARPGVPCVNHVIIHNLGYNT